MEKVAGLFIWGPASCFVQRGRNTNIGELVKAIRYGEGESS